jgi:hypothetical protein
MSVSIRLAAFTVDVRMVSFSMMMGRPVGKPQVLMVRIYHCSVKMK